MPIPGMESVRIEGKRGINGNGEKYHNQSINKIFLKIKLRKYHP